MRIILITFAFALGVFGADTPQFVTVSAASYAAAAPLAPGVIAAGFGTNLAATTEVAPATGPLPIVLAQTSVAIRDSQDVTRTAPLWFVSPSQINYYIDEQTALGPATVSVMRGAETVASGTIQVDSVAPGLFTANTDGQGVPAALAVFARPGEELTWRYVFDAGCQVGTCQPAPLDPGADADQLYLELYGTGIRGRSALEAATATIGGVDTPVEYAGPVSGLVGLDQVNLKVPKSLSGQGEVDVAVTVDGKIANTVRVNIALAVPTQLSPPDGSVFSNYPRTTTLEWSAVPAAVKYGVEVDCFHCCVTGQWCSDVGGGTLQAETASHGYTFEFSYGAQPGRWRVWAIGDQGQTGAKTGWWEFRYTQ